MRKEPEALLWTLKGSAEGPVIGPGVASAVVADGGKSESPPSYEPRQFHNTRQTVKVWPPGLHPLQGALSSRLGAQPSSKLSDSGSSSSRRVHCPRAPT